MNEIPVAPETEESVNLVNPTGDLVALPKSALPDALKQGYEQATPEVVDKYQKEEKYGGTGEQIKTALEGGASAATFGLSTGVEKALGVNPEDIQGRRETNPISHGAGQVAGLVGTALLPGLGEANAARVMEGAGAVGVKALGLGAAEGLGAKVAAGATKAAIENAMFQGGDEVSKMLSGDPYQSVETAAANVGLAGLLGAGIGGAIGTVSPLWKASGGERLGQFIEDFKGRINEHMVNPEPGAAVTKELGDLYHGTRSVADEVYGPQGIKAQEIQKLMPEMSEKISTQTQELNNKIGDTLKSLKDDPHVNQLQDAVEKYQSKITSPDVTPGEIFNSSQELKQQLQEWGKYNKNFSPLGERRFREAAKDLAYSMRTSLEDSSVWGKAAERQGVINKAFSEYLPTLKDFEKKFTVEVGGEKVIDPGKVNTFLNQQGKMTGAVRREMLGNFIEAAEKYKKVIGDSHATLGIDSPISDASLSLTKSAMQEMTPGAKLADSLVKKGLADLGGKAAGAVVGGGVGAAVGHPGLGAIIGEHTLGHFFSSILPAIAKPLLESQASSTGLKNAVDYGMHVINGERMIDRGARAVFKSPREVLSSKALEVSQNDRDRLDKKMDEYRKDPEKMLALGGATGHYLPDHATAITDTAGRVMQYLDTVKPRPTKNSPLDAEIQPSAMQKAAYDRAMNIAEKPLSVLEHIKNNTLQASDVAGLRAMYPSLYQKLAQKLTDSMIEHVSNEEHVPYAMRQSLSLFLGQPLDSTLTPAGIQAAQSVFAQQKNNQQGQMPSGGGGKSSGSPKALTKVGARFQTAEQSTIARQNSQKA